MPAFACGSRGGLPIHYGLCGSVSWRVRRFPPSPSTPHSLIAWHKELCNQKRKCSRDRSSTLYSTIPITGSACCGCRREGIATCKLSSAGRLRLRQGSGSRLPASGRTTARTGRNSQPSTSRSRSRARLTASKSTWDPARYPGWARPTRRSSSVRSPTKSSTSSTTRRSACKKSRESALCGPAAYSPLGASRGSCGRSWCSCIATASARPALTAFTRSTAPTPCA